MTHLSDKVYGNQISVFLLSFPSSSQNYVIDSLQQNSKIIFSILATAKSKFFGFIQHSRFWIEKSRTCEEMHTVVESVILHFTIPESSVELTQPAGGSRMGSVANAP